MFYHVLADLMSAVHLALMVYVIFGQLLLLVGLVFRWQWLRNPWFRWTHMAAILTVAAEALLGISCPLTNWEEELRERARQETWPVQIVTAPGLVPAGFVAPALPYVVASTPIAGLKPSALGERPSFTAQLVHKFLFPLDAFPHLEYILTLCYYGFALLVLITFILLPPRLPAPRGHVNLRLRCPGTPENGRRSVGTVLLERPGQGASTQTVLCPCCEQKVGIQVRSRRRFWPGVGLVVLLGAAITCLGFYLPQLHSALTGEPLWRTRSGAIWRTGWENAVTVIGLLLMVLAPSGLLVRRALIGKDETGTDRPRQRHRVLA